MIKLVESIEETLIRLLYAPILNHGEKHFVKTIIRRMKEPDYSLNRQQVKKIKDLSEKLNNNFVQYPSVNSNKNT